MIKLNPDSKYVEEVREAIKNNMGYCCCKLENVSQNLCPCLEFRVNKVCECDLYVNDNN